MMRLCQLLDNEILRSIRILILIYQNILETLLPLRQNFRMIAEKHIRIEQNIVEVHGLCLTTTSHILGINLRHARHTTISVSLLDIRRIEVIFGRNQRVLGIGNAARHRRYLISLVVELQFFDDGFQQTFRIVGVVNAEVGRVAESSRFCAEKIGL